MGESLIAPGSIPRSLLRTFNFEIWKLKCLGACPEDLYWIIVKAIVYDSAELHGPRQIEIAVESEEVMMRSFTQPVK